MKWDTNGGHTMKDDDMMDEIEINIFRVDNMEDLDDMSINLGTTLGTSTHLVREDDRSHHAHTTEIGGRKEDEEGSSQESEKQHWPGKAVTPDAKAAKKLRASGDSDSSMEASREKEPQQQCTQRLMRGPF